MKKALVIALLVFAVAQAAETAQLAQAQTANSSVGQKVIQDQAEYNAYITALNTADPAAKAAAMEAFARQYPQSVVLTDALEQAMAAYQQAGDQAGVENTARRILKITPDHVRALAIVVTLDRAKAAADKAALAEGCADAQTGSAALAKWSKPDSMSDADFAAVRDRISDIFYGALGFCALQKKDWAAARLNYEKAFAIDPKNLQDVYQLAVADLEQSPIDLNGIWYCDKAIQLAEGMNNSGAVGSITPYCKAKYRKYHGSEDGWDQILSSANAQQAVPAGFAASIKPAPTPCEIAVQAVQQNDPADLSFSDREFILSKAGCSSENKAAADKVWQSIEAMEKNGAARLKLPVKVIASTPDSIDAAITDDNQAANKADLHIVMEKPMLQPPKQGATIDIIGVLTGYTPEPFLFTMEKGQLPEL